MSGQKEQWVHSEQSFSSLFFHGRFCFDNERGSKMGKKGGDVKINRLSTTLILDVVTLHRFSLRNKFPRNFFTTLHPIKRQVSADNSLVRTRLMHILSTQGQLA